MQPGPPPEPGSEKRILLAFVLTFVVIAVMQPLISRYVKPPEQPKQTQSAGEPSASTPSASQPAAPTAVAQAAGEGARATQPGAKKKSAGESPASTQSQQVPTKQATA